MAIFIVLWPYLLTTKLRSVIHHNLGHSNLDMSRKESASSKINELSILSQNRLHLSNYTLIAGGLEVRKV